MRFNRNDSVRRALLDPSEKLVETFWNNLPSPIEVDLADAESVRRLFSAMLRSLDS